MVEIPVWLQVAFGVAALAQPFIIWLLTVAHSDRKQLLAQVNKINGRIGVLEDWRIIHERWKEEQIKDLREDIRRIEDNSGKR